MMSQFTKGQKSRLMYLENKEGDIDGYTARIGWVTFSKTGLTVKYRGRSLARLKGGGVSGNYYCEDSGDEYWISGVKKRGSNVHDAEAVEVYIDEDAREAYAELRR